MRLQDRCISDHRRVFGCGPESAAWAPGRVCILGGHVDFTGGCVMPAALEVGVAAAVSPAGGDQVVIYSSDKEESASFPAAQSRGHGGRHWSKYAQGVLYELQPLTQQSPGLRITITGDISMGTGLSSSAALEVAVAMALLGLLDSTVEPLELARLCQRAENDFVGVKCGIMDQFASIYGRRGSAIFLDCRSLEHRYLSLPDDTCIIVADSMKPRHLAACEYNARRSEVDQALEELRLELPYIEMLREVSALDLVDHGHRLSPAALRRAKHVVGETERVQDAVRALDERNWREFGRLMCESHESSRDLYESTIPELNILWEAACSHPGCVGSRLTGAGFGGCTVSIVQNAAADDFARSLSEAYLNATGITASVARHSAGSGAERFL